MYITIETLDQGTIKAKIISLNSIKVETDSGKYISVEEIYEKEREIEDDEE